MTESQGGNPLTPENDSLPHLPLFVYGTLRRGKGATSLLKDVVDAKEAAVARGRYLSTGEPLTAVRFSEDGIEIRGELLWLSADAYERTLQDLDRYEGVPDLFERVEVSVWGRKTERVAAFAYQWARPGSLVGEYLRAVERKIEVAQYHLTSLEAFLRGKSATGSEPSVEVQAHFEGVLFAAVAAEDQLAETINIGLKLDLGHPSLQKVLEAARAWDLAADLNRWRQERIAADYREVRRLMTHHWSRKTVQGPLIEVQEVARGEYRGDRELSSYARAVVAHLNRLGEILPRIASRLDEGD